MAKECETWNEIISSVEDRCNEILFDKVVPEMKDIIQKHIQSDIYDAYTPKPNGWVDTNGMRATYERRKTLTNERNFYSIISAPAEVFVTINATASKPIVKGSIFQNRYPGAFLKMLEEGRMGIWRYGFPRPAITNAQKEIDKSSTIRQIIEAELNK